MVRYSAMPEQPNRRFDRMSEAEQRAVEATRWLISRAMQERAARTGHAPLAREAIDLAQVVRDEAHRRIAELGNDFAAFADEIEAQMGTPPPRRPTLADIIAALRADALVCADGVDPPAPVFADPGLDDLPEDRGDARDELDDDNPFERSAAI